MNEEEFMVELADAIEQAMEWEEVRYIEDANVIVVTMADGARFRVSVARLKDRLPGREEPEEEQD